MKKLILISSGPFKNPPPARPTPYQEINAANFKEYAKSSFLSEMHDPIVSESEALDYQFDLYQKVWGEAKKLRESGKLLERGFSMQCPVAAIHGDDDPRPYEGVKDPLSQVLKNFCFHLIPNCGHYPWYERKAKEKFYEILLKEIS